MKLRVHSSPPKSKKYAVCIAAKGRLNRARLLECPPFHRTAWLGLSADLNATGERMASAECGWTVL